MLAPTSERARREAPQGRRLDLARTQAAPTDAEAGRHEADNAEVLGARGRPNPAGQALG